MKSAAHRRMYAAAEAMLPGLRTQNLAAVARAAADVAAAMIERGQPWATTPAERARLAAVVGENTDRFRVHLSQRSTAEAWESFDVPWDRRRTLESIEAGRYAATLTAEAIRVTDTLVALFSDEPPRTLRRARALGERASQDRGGPDLLVR